MTVPSLSIPLVGGGAGFFAIFLQVMMNQDNSRKIIAEALRQTELWLEDQQQVVASAEQRALQFSSACLLIAALGAGFAKDLPSPVTTYICTAGLIFAAYWATFSTLPRKFYHRGHYWRDWQGHIPDADSFYEVLVSQAKENDERIEFNRRTLEASAAHFFVSFVASLMSISIFVLGQLLVFWDS